MYIIISYKKYSTPILKIHKYFSPNREIVYILVFKNLLLSVENTLQYSN